MLRRPNLGVMHKLAAVLAFGLLAAFPPAATAGPYSDYDHDRLTNRAEKKAGTNPRRKDTDRDGLRDALEDPDRDRVDNLAEALQHTHPRRKDSDRDGVGDGLEDADRDRLVNYVEDAAGTHPMARDGDGDGLTDAREGAGRVVAVEGRQVTIALGTSRVFRSGEFSPTAFLASNAAGHLTGRAELPHALLCGSEDEWLGPVDTSTDELEIAAQEEAAADDGELDGEESDEEVARADAEDGNAGRMTGEYAASSSDAPAPAPAPAKVEGNPVLSDDVLEKLEDAEYEAMGHEEDPNWRELSDACPPNTFKPGAWVHEVAVDTSEEAGVEFEEIVIVR